jgi:DNA replication and repair protein RecF
MSFHKIHNLTLYQFKNYHERTFEFNAEVVCVTGLNGSGKTSLLDAIHCLCFTKSYFTHIDSNLIQFGMKGLRIQGLFVNDDSLDIKFVLREDGRKEFYCNQLPYLQLSKHIGKLSCVMISPDDIAIVAGASEVRRKFLDTHLSQIDSQYLLEFINHNKVLHQRNAYLKNAQGSMASIDLSLIQIYNAALEKSADYIFNKRKEFVMTFNEIVSRFYNMLSDKNENVSIAYISSLAKSNYSEQLSHNLHKDIALGRTSFGIHKDDLNFTLQEMPMKQVASQGQRKSFLFGLKLAQFQLLQQAKHVYPILLLDDVFEKIDAVRSGKLIQYLLNLPAQIFITDTHIERVREAFQESNREVQQIQL